MSGDAQKILEEIRRAGDSGLTCDQVEVRTGMAHQTASARITGLSRKHEILDRGVRRPTRSGRDAIVWVSA